MREMSNSFDKDYSHNNSQVVLAIDLYYVSVEEHAMVSCFFDS